MSVTNFELKYPRTTSRLRHRGVRKTRIGEVRSTRLAEDLDSIEFFPTAVDGKNSNTIIIIQLQWLRRNFRRLARRPINIHGLRF